MARCDFQQNAVPYLARKLCTSGIGRNWFLALPVLGSAGQAAAEDAAAERENVCSEGSEAQESDRFVGTSGSRDELQRERP